MAIIATTGAVKVPVYNSPLVVASGGYLWLAYPYGEDLFTKAGNQGSAPLLANVLISMCFLNLAVYAVDGQTITTLPLATGNVTPYPMYAVQGPVAPTVTQTGTSSLAAQTYYTRVTYTFSGSESIGSAETLTTVVANKLVKVTSPATSAGVTGYNVYMSLSTGTETLQTATPIAIGTDWTLPSTGLIVGAPVPLGLTPTNCCLCCNWRGRFVLAGDSNNPQNFYMARVGQPTDWNYSATDPAAAVAGNLSESGQIGEPIVALIPYTDDYMLIACTNSLWMLQGDPADGGSIVRVSDQMGLVSPNSWCVDPGGTLYFIARGGLYSVRPIWEFYQPPQLLSGESYDQYFQQIINGSYYISMQWDVDAKYMHIFATPTDEDTVGVHLIFDQRNGGLWPQVYPLTQGPTATCRYAANSINGERAILIGGWDGYIRSWTATNLDDDGTAISAYAVLGPVKADAEASLLSGITIDFGEVTAADQNPGPVQVTKTTAFHSGNFSCFVLTGGQDVDLTTVQVYFNNTLQVLGTGYSTPTINGAGNLIIPTLTSLAGVTVTVSYQYAGTVPWNATVTLQAGPDAYSVTEGTPHSTTTIPSTLDRRQKTYRQRLRAGWFSVVISNDTLDTYFSFESALLEFMGAGRNRERR